MHGLRLKYDRSDFWEHEIMFSKSSEMVKGGRKQMTELGCQTNCICDLKLIHISRLEIANKCSDENENNPNDKISS